MPCALRAHTGVRHAVARVSGSGDLVKDINHRPPSLQAFPVSGLGVCKLGVVPGFQRWNSPESVGASSRAFTD